MTNIHKSVWITFILFSVFLFSVNYVFPTQSDDLGAGFGGLDGAISMYMSWNGRFGELLRTAFIGALAPTLFFKIANTLVGVVFLLAWFVILYARLPRSFNDSVVLALSVLCILLFGAFGSIFVWAAGALNYLWAYTLVLLVCIPYRLFWHNYFTHKSTSYSPQILILIPFFIVSFFAGMSNEITGVIVVVIHICLIFYAVFIAKIRLPFWYYAGVILFVLGFLALYLSPGHAKRAALSASQGHFYSLGTLWQMSLYEKLQRINDVLRPRGVTIATFACFALLFFYERYKSKSYKHIAIAIVIIACATGMQFLGIFPHTTSVIMFLIIMYYAYYIYKKEYNTTLSRYYLYAFLIFAVLHVFLLLTIQAVFSGRAGLFVVLAGALHYILLYRAILFLHPSIECKLQYGVCICVFLYAMFVLSAFIDMRIKWETMVKDVAQQKAQGIEDIAVSSKYFHSFYKHYGDWDSPGTDPKAFPNPLYAQHFGVKSFVVKE
ncbi:DUF6056 family protein [Helicobacter bilis]|uniref:DUF6056 family protein n=1 Tax=Helicobacter bilis TaxID=37372 RepID=UPI00248EBEE1|nr:DUF6056 family protein [Helicobacter bilis]